MRRVTFQPEFQVDILREEKIQTMRLSPLKWRIGEVVAAVSPKDGKPGFLVPASEAFCYLRLVDERSVFWVDVTEEDADKCGVTKDWYRERYGARLTDFTRVFIYEFQRVGHYKFEVVR